MPTNQHNIGHIQDMMKNFSRDEYTQVRDYIDNRIQETTPGEQRNIGGAGTGVEGPDASADSEKKKYIAQYGTNPIAQETAQSVPQPESEEVKKLQDEKAKEEHMAKGPAADGSH
jgi:hypothetical protein